MKEFLVKTRVERANLRWSVNDLILKVREASVDLSGACRAVVKSSDHSSKDNADKAKAEMGQVWKRTWFLLDKEYARL